MSTKTQINKINKSLKNGTGADIKISKTQIRKGIQKGGSLWTFLISLATRALPYVTKGLSEVVPHLATGA